MLKASKAGAKAANRTKRMVIGQKLDLMQQSGFGLKIFVLGFTNHMFGSRKKNLQKLG